VIFGLLVAKAINNKVEDLMYVQTKVKLHLDFSATAILNGICVASILTALALIVPISDNLQIQLRDALDIFRH
jgi:hypothetical protein